MAAYQGLIVAALTKLLHIFGTFSTAWASMTKRLCYSHSGKKADLHNLALCATDI